MAKFGRQAKIWTMMILSGVYFVIELVFGFLTNSLTLIADSFHMLSDVLALMIALYAIRIAKKSSEHNTYGWQRAEVLGALVNSVFLLALTFSIFLDALHRFIEPLSQRKIDNPMWIVVVGSVGLAINLVGIILFHDVYSHGHSGHSHGKKNTIEDGRSYQFQTTAGLVRCESFTIEIEKGDAVSLLDDTLPGTSVQVDSPEGQNNSNVKVKQSSMDNNEENNGTVLDSSSSTKNVSHRRSANQNLNMRALFIHILGDALGSVGVIITGLVVWFGKSDSRFLADPIISMAIVVILVITTVPLLKDSGLILLQGVPESIDVEKLKKEILSVPGVLEAHELHVWQLSDAKNIASTHITFDVNTQFMNVATAITQVFHDHDIHSSTIQPEFVFPGQNSSSPEGYSCLLKCAAACETNFCCPPVTLQSSVVSDLVNSSDNGTTVNPSERKKGDKRPRSQ